MWSHSSSHDSNLATAPSCDTMLDDSDNKLPDSQRTLLTRGGIVAASRQDPLVDRLA